MSTYQYNLVTDFPQGAANVEKLEGEIRSSAITISLQGISLAGNTISIVFNAALPAPDKTRLDGDMTGPAGGLIAQHDSALLPPIEQVEIQEEHTPTNGKFQASGISFYAPAGTTSTHDFSWPFPVSILDFWWTTDSEDRGDTGGVCVGPDTITGALTANASISDTVLNVQRTVVENTYPGDTIKLYDGVQLEDAGRVISRNLVTNQLTLESGLSLAFLAASPTYVQSTTHIIPVSEIGRATEINIGRSKIGASHIPANVIVQVHWTNHAPVHNFGQLSQDVAASANTIFVDASAAEHLVYGSGIQLDDGTNTDDLGTVTFINKVTGEVTFTTATVNAFAAATPTNVQLTGKRITGFVEYLR